MEVPKVESFTSWQLSYCFVIPVILGFVFMEEQIMKRHIVRFLLVLAVLFSGDK